MQYIKDVNNYELDGRSVITLGKFDGVHRGHRKLIRRVKELAREMGARTTIFTFDIPPQVEMGARRQKMLMTNAERADFLRDMDTDVLVECPFTEEVRCMSAEDFVKNILLDRLHMQAAVVGPDFHFGRNRQGSAAFLREAGERYGFAVEVVAKEKDEGVDISSSRIRSELECGRIEHVNRMLGYPYFVTGPIVHGRHLGHSLGFPTINQIPDPEKMLPPFGVYISRTAVAGKIYQGVSNIGVKPTVQGHFVGVETYLFDCSLDLYGQEAKVDLLHYRRPEKKFDSIDELKEQMDLDIQAADEFFSKNG